MSDHHIENIAHSRLGPSASERWLPCPGSFKAEQGYPDEDTWDSARGTVFHHLSELCFVKDCTADRFGGETYSHGGFSFTIDQQDIDQINLAVSYVRKQCKDPLLETRVDFSEYVENGFGTSDVLFMRGTTLEVQDFKFGGVQVGANSSQLKFYGLGGLLYFDYEEITEVRLTIIQPMLDSYPQHVMPVEEVIEFGEYARGRAQLAMSDNPPFVPGKHCRFCKHRKRCKPRAEYVEYHVGKHFESDKSTLEPEDYARLLRLSRDLLPTFSREIEEEAKRLLDARTPVYGHKLVNGRRHKKWRDGALAAAPDEVIRYSLPTPAEAIRILGKDHPFITKYVRTPKRGKPVLVPVEDSREAIEDRISKMFN